MITPFSTRKARKMVDLMLLSRVVEFQLMAISMPQANWWTKLQDGMVHDPFYAYLDTYPPPGCFKHEGIWYKAGRLFLRPNSSLLPTIMMEAHSSPIGGHFVYHKTLSRLKTCFVWPGMRTSIKQFIRECDTCQRCK